MTYDLIIIGGGINGAAIARDAALNGLKVLLAEKDDLASHTSSASTKLIHGGLRYLEYYEFRLVREALQERERLMRLAPHLIHPMQFVLPHINAPRPWLMVRMGLWLYDRLGGKSSLPRSRGLKKSDAIFRAPLKGEPGGFVYSDGWVDDSRFVVLNAMDAARNGADIRTRCGVVATRRSKGVWTVELASGETVSARALVNAAGPWVALVDTMTGVEAKAGVRLVKGSHIIVEQLFAGDQAYMLQQPDKRIVFAIPYQQGLTLIGTTDVPVESPENPQLSREETEYLCEAASRYFNCSITPADVVAGYAGIRPLYDDGASEAKAVTRDYVLELDANGPPLLSVYGGKITTARHLAESALAKLAPVMGVSVGTATRITPYAGGNLPLPFPGFLAQVRERWPFLGEVRSKRMARAYGTMLGTMLEDVKDEADMGQPFGGGLTQVEVDWLIREEWARTPADILERRTKIGLMTGPETVTALTHYMEGLES